MKFLNFFILILLSSCLGKMGNSLGTNESKETSLIQSTNAEASSPAVQGESDAGSGTGSSEMYFDPECGNEPFVATFKLGEEKKIKLGNISNGDKVSIDWGDGSDLQLLENYHPVYRIYESKEVGDEINIQISGKYSSLKVHTDSKIQKVSNLGSLCWKNFKWAFYEQDELSTLSGGNTSEVYNMDGMFRGATSFNGDLSSFNTENVSNMYSMFRGASSFNQDLSNFNTGNVTNMSSMFYGANSFNGDLSSFNTENVTDMSYMFREASSFNQDLSNFNTEKVTDMRWMFTQASMFNHDLSSFNTSNVTDMTYMFANASSFDGNISNFNTQNVINMDSMFKGASSFNQNLSNFNTEKVTNMRSMFSRAKYFDQDLSNFNTEKVTDMRWMFSEASSFNQDLSNFDTSNVLKMSYMFYRAELFNQDLLNFDTKNVTDMRFMFENANSFNGNLSSFNTKEVTNMNRMFYRADSFNGDLSNFNFNKITNNSFISYSFHYVNNLSDENYSMLLNRFVETNETLENANIGSVPACYLPSAKDARDELLSRGWTLDDEGPCEDSSSNDSSTTTTSSTSTSITTSTTTSSTTTTLSDINNPPTFPSIFETSVLSGENVSFTLPAATDPDGDSITYDKVGDFSGNHGYLNCSASNSFTRNCTYNANDGVLNNPTDEFKYKAIDSNGAETENTIKITITEKANTHPVFNEVAEATVTSLKHKNFLLPAATDPDGDLLSYFPIGNFTSSHGILDCATGTIFTRTCTYTSTKSVSSNYIDEFQYRVDDGRGGNATNSIKVTIIPDTTSTSSSSIDAVYDVGPNPNFGSSDSITIDVSTNDLVESGCGTVSYEVSGIINPNHVTVSGNGPEFIINVNPPPGCLAPYKFTYTATCSDSGESDSATVESQSQAAGCG